MNMKKMVKIVIVVAVAATSMLPCFTEARLGENITETDKRYGKPTFSYGDKVNAYRIYNYKGKEIEVIFYDSEAVFEFINFSKEMVFGSEAAQQASQESTEFICSILSSAYNFSEQDILAMSNVRMQGVELVSSHATESATALYSLNISRVESEGVLSGTLRLNSSKVDNEGVREKCIEIINAANQAKHKATVKKTSSGF